MTEHSLNDARVAAALAGEAYDGSDGEPSVADALDVLGDALGWATPDGGPFGAMIPAGANVVVKPNWVLHRNQGPGGFAPLVTHPAVLRAAVDAVLRTGAGRVTVGDAPVQGCDFAALLRASSLEGWDEEMRRRDDRFAGVVDFRRTVADESGLLRTQRTDLRGLDHFVLFDLGTESLLEPITVEGAFRVTMYDPALMQRTHAPGRHQYLVAREVLEADVVVNLPKLKTHKKAGVTCALKNLIGINGNKEFLPHHRVGGAGAGGDCYPGRSPIKRSLEAAYDVHNSGSAALPKALTAATVRVLDKVARMSGDELGVEGSWSGNDTIWRTCLDLNRILLYGRADGTLADRPQRTVLNVVDAVIAGQGDGPLSPTPLPLGLLLGGASSAAVDWMGASLLGYDPARIPIARHAFDRFRWPLTAFPAGEVRLVAEDRVAERVRRMDAKGASRAIDYPVGWRDAVATRPVRQELLGAR